MQLLLAEVFAEMECLEQVPSSYRNRISICLRQLQKLAKGQVVVKVAAALMMKIQSKIREQASLKDHHLRLPL